MRIRVLAATMAAAFVAIIAIGLPLAVLIGRRYHEDAVLELVQAATVARFEIPTSGEPPDGFEGAQGSAITIGYYDQTGTRLAGEGPATADLPTNEALATASVRHRDVGNELVAAVPVTTNEQVIGVVRAAKPISLIDDRTHRAWLALSAIATLALGLAAAVGALAARRLSRPVNRLRDDAVRLGEGDFTVGRRRSGIAEIDEATEALATTARRVHDLLARERAFSADASHQLRTPLTSLRLALETERAAPRAERDELIGEALHEVDRLEHTIDSLLTLARDTAPDRAEVDVDALARGAVERWRVPLAAKGRSVRLDEPTGPMAVHVSASAINHVLDVCFDNALRHGAGLVTLAVTAGPTSTTLSVSDEGPGIADPSTLFVRRAGGGAGGGHGIGLSLARSLVEAEGGRFVCARTGPHPRFDVVLLSDPD